MVAFDTDQNGPTGVILLSCGSPAGACELAALIEPCQAYFQGATVLAAFLYRCPNTGHSVQGFFAEEVSDDPDAYKSVECLACGRMHFVNPITGKVLGEDDE